MRMTFSGLVAIAILFQAGAALAADPAVTCESGELGVAGKYGACRLKAEAKAVKTGDAVDYSKCDSTFSTKWGSAETKAGPGVCPSEGDKTDIKAMLDGVNDDVTDFLAAGRFDASGATIIDHKTGLEWEKKTGTAGGSNVCPGDPTCGSVHDVNNAYSWGSTSPPYAPSGNAYIDFLAKLNSDDGSGNCYAGHCDWRLPTIEELSGIVDLSAAGCGSGSPCLGTEFLPNAASLYWSASTYAPGPLLAWFLGTTDGGAGNNYKTDDSYVRAVRSGS